MTETWRTNDVGDVGYWTRLAEHRVKLAAATYAVGTSAKVQTPSECWDYVVVSVNAGFYTFRAWRLALDADAPVFPAIEATDYPHDTTCVLTW